MSSGNGYNLYEAAERADRVNEKQIALSLTHLAIDIGEIVLSYKQMDSKRSDTMQTLIDASRAYCRQVSVVASSTGNNHKFSVGTYRLGSYISQPDLALLADLLEVSVFALSDIGLGVDVESTGLLLSLGRSDDSIFVSWRVSREYRPYLVFIFAAPKIVPEIVENMKMMLRQSRDLTDRLTDLADQVSGIASLSRL